MHTLNIGFQPSPSLLRRRPPRHQNLSLLSILFFACSCLFLQLGCLALPIPQGYRDITREGKKIEPYELNFVVPGQTTKAEFIEKIGQPYLMLDDCGVMAYYWSKLAAYVPWVVPYAAAGIGEVDRHYLLLISYDDRGVIEHYEFWRKYSDQLIKTSTKEKVIRQWASKMHCLKSSSCAQ